MVKRYLFYWLLTGRSQYPSQLDANGPVNGRRSNQSDRCIRRLFQSESQGGDPTSGSDRGMSLTTALLRPLGAMMLLAGTVGAPRIIDIHKAEIDSAGVELLLPRMDLVRGRICS